MKQKEKNYSSIENKINNLASSRKKDSSKTVKGIAQFNLETVSFKKEYPICSTQMTPYMDQR